MDKRNLAYVYFSLVPILAFVLAFSIGHSSYAIYIPVWIIFVCCSIFAGWTLSGHTRNQLSFAGALLIIPVICVSIFAGMGPPPGSIADWVATGTEQQIRYGILIASGVVLALGFATLRNGLIPTKGKPFADVGMLLFLTAIPLFILNMTFWSDFVLFSFESQAVSTPAEMPDWFKAMLKQFDLVSRVEVSLMYLTTTFFGLALKSAGWFKGTPSSLYVAISLTAFVAVVFYPLYASVVAFMGFFPLLIPAVPFMLPYYIGVNLLRKAGN